MTIKKTLIILILIVLGVVYFKFNPQDTSFFPKCPVYHFTGLKCPGCGSQRAIHHLLHFDFVSAFKANGLMVLSIPYIAFGLIYDNIQTPTAWMLRWRKFLFGRTAIAIVLIIIILFFLLRNC